MKIINATVVGKRGGYTWKMFSTGTQDTSGHPKYKVKVLIYATPILISKK